MSRSKSMVVAMADFGMAMRVKNIKYGLILIGAFGPLLVAITIGLPLFFTDPMEPGYQEMIAYLLPMAVSTQALITVIPATLIAANAIVGEREQNTLEPLLCSPLTDKELLWGKALSSFIPCAILLIAGTSASTIIVAAMSLVAGKPLFIFPDLPGAVLLFVGGPIVILAIVSVMILISQRVSRVYEAYQTGSIVAMIFVVPMFAPITMAGSGVPTSEGIWFSYLVTILIAAAVASITWVLTLRQFNRDHLVSMV